jgi:hypothetical protein
MPGAGESSPYQGAEEVGNSRQRGWVIQSGGVELVDVDGGPNEIVGWADTSGVAS